MTRSVFRIASLLLAASASSAQTAFAPEFFYTDGAEVRRFVDGARTLVHTATAGWEVPAIGLNPSGALFFAEEDVAGTVGRLYRWRPKKSVLMYSFPLAGARLQDIDVSDDGTIWFCTDREAYRLYGPGLVTLAYTAPATHAIRGVAAGCDGDWYVALEVLATSRGSLVFGRLGGTSGTMLNAPDPMVDVDVVHDTIYAASENWVWRFDGSGSKLLFSGIAVGIEAIAGDGVGNAYFQGASSSFVVGENGGGLRAIFNALAPVRDLDVVPSPWWTLGGQTSGTAGVPVLVGLGLAGEGRPVSLRVTGARSFAPLFFVGGQARLDAPFLGGRLVPTPDQLILGFTDATGTAELPFTLSSTLACPHIYFQAVIREPTLPGGFALTNGVSGLWD